MVDSLVNKKHVIYVRYSIYKKPGFFGVTEMVTFLFYGILSAVDNFGNSYPHLNRFDYLERPNDLLCTVSILF